jgi:hypothetical protein
MKTSISDNEKTIKRGRPRVDSTFVGVRLPPEQLKTLDNWRREQEDIPTRPEAIRRLIEQALKHK